jgi:hypothetical protein
MFLQKCPRKADHLPEPFLGFIYIYELGMYRKADSCTLAWYVLCSCKYVWCMYLPEKGLACSENGFAFSSMRLDEQG